MTQTKKLFLKTKKTKTQQHPNCTPDGMQSCLQGDYITGSGEGVCFVTALGDHFLPVPNSTSKINSSGVSVAPIPESIISTLTDPCLSYI